MPPQPLSRVRHESGFTFDPGALRKRPTLAPFVLDVIAIWSNTDSMLAQITSTFLNADFEVVTAMLQALASSEGRLAAMRAAAKHVLSDEDYQLLEAVLKVTKPSRERRNQFAHHLWGYAEELPEALLLMDPKHLHMMSAEMNADSAKRKMGWHSTSFDVGDALTALQANVFVYRENDLRESVQAAEDAYGFIHRLRFVFNREHPSSEKMRTLLLTQPPIQQALQHSSNESDP